MSWAKGTKIQTVPAHSQSAVPVRDPAACLYGGGPRGSETAGNTGDGPSILGAGRKCDQRLNFWADSLCRADKTFPVITFKKTTAITLGEELDVAVAWD